ncbi:gpW family head-tail joining protein [Limimaricola pyoseonensis]|uniref:GpW protein n=1 Tax=Limimaricola pyoseonensis TaxID=521013 RepID=A0A1G7GR40_9RHOB|nr:gpW family head-tail joining protein [Limimaricola pyoseonensis]SDE90429.1 gpW protein [Limimaricola pyoseonensis]
MADDAILQARLDEAEGALHQLMTGSQVVAVGYDGDRQEYSRANEAGLRRYIRSLKRQLGQAVGTRSRRVIY